MQTGVEESTKIGFEREKVLPSLIIGVVIVVFAVLLPMVNRSISSERAVEKGSTLDVGLGVSFIPAVEWSLHTDATSPGNNDAGGYISLSKAGLVFYVKAEKYDDDLEAFHNLISDQFNKSSFRGFSSIENQKITTKTGYQGFSQLFSFNGVEGQLSALTEEGIGISFIARGTDGVYFRYYTEIQDMIGSLVVMNGEESRHD